MSVLNAALGGVMGLALGAYNDKRQLKQQKKLQDLEIAGQKEMGAYNYAQNMKWWEETNYEAQIKQMEKAGLNPGLLYGMGAGGGATTVDNRGNITGGHANPNSQADVGMGLQIGLMEAQKKVLETQAEKNQAEADSTRGVEGTTGASQIGLNVANTKLLKVTEEIQQIEKEWHSETLQDRINQIDQEQSLRQKQIDILENDKQISDATKQTKIDQIKQDLATSKAQEGLLKSGVSKNKAEMAKMGADIAQRAQEIIQKNRQIDIQAFEAEFKANNPGIMNLLGGVASDTINDIYWLFSGTERPSRQTISTKPNK